MTTFQDRTRRQIDRALAEVGHTVDWQSVDCGADALSGTSAGDIYLQALFEHSGRKHTIYVYPDEAGLDIAGDWHIFEVQDFRGDLERLSGAFLQAIRNYLGGTAPNVAFAIPRSW